MTNDVLGPNPIGDDELERRLQAYARTRLAPAPDAMARIRSAVVAEADELARARGRARPRLRLLPGLRRPAAALLAASLAVVLAVGGVAAAARPGGPLYDTRVWFETLNLPNDPAARAQAQLGRLQERLEEAETGTREGNGGAVQAALDEYEKIVDETLAAPGGRPAGLSDLEIALQRHLAVLQSLAGRLPEPANDAVERALERQEQHIDQILADHPANSGPGGPNAGGQGPGVPKSSPPAGGPPGTTGPGTTHQPGGRNGHGPGPHLFQTAAPSPSPSPTLTPSPTQTASPTQSPRSSMSPRP